MIQGAAHSLHVSRNVRDVGVAGQILSPDQNPSTALLCRLATDDEHGLRAELLQRFHSARLTARPTPVKKSRTVAALLDEAEQLEQRPAVRKGKCDV